MLGDGQSMSCKATASQVGWVLMLGHSPPHWPHLAFLRTDAFPADDDSLTGNGHPQTTHQPRARSGLAEGAALCSAAPLVPPCLPPRSPQPGPYAPAVCSQWHSTARSSVAPWPQHWGPGPVWELSRGPVGEVGSIPTRGDFCSLAEWQLFL